MVNGASVAQSAFYKPHNHNDHGACNRRHIYLGKVKRLVKKLYLFFGVSRLCPCESNALYPSLGVPCRHPRTAMNMRIISCLERINQFT